MGVEILCTACGEETLLKREPVYEGFKKMGESLLCSACGHEYAEESDVPFTKKESMSLFSDADKTPVIDVFNAEEKGRNCRHCEHYVKNPFTQRCGLHDKVVEATDVCFDFSEMKQPEPEEEEEASE